MGNFSLSVGKRILKNKLRHFSRVREGHNFETAKSVGILFTPTDQASFEQIKQFVTYLNQYKLQIYVLGYIDSKTIPESFLFWKGINLFSRKDLKFWTMVAKTPVVADFVEKQFDILLDLSIYDFFPIEYTSRLSKAKFKVGRFTPKHTAFDLMFELDSQPSLVGYLNYVKDYLNLINRHN